MADVMVVFGSASDNAVYRPLLDELSAEEISFEFRVLSAHKTPSELREAVGKSSARIFVAGAGLSAALPGVVAAQTIRPVIGIPCGGTFGGLDAFLSILQMPPGIPVLALGIGNAREAVKHAANYLEGYRKVVIVKRKTSPAVMKAIRKCESLLESFGIKRDVTNRYDYCGEKELFIDFVPLAELPLAPKTDSTVIIVPVADSSTPKTAISLMEACKKHLWVGLNNGENAGLGAVQLLNPKGKYDKALQEYREGKKARVLGADKEEGITDG